LNPRGARAPPALKTGRTSAESSADLNSFMEVTPPATTKSMNTFAYGFKYPYPSIFKGISVPRIIVENNRVVIEFTSADDLSKFINFLQSLGVTNNIEKREVRIEYDEWFWEYLIKDRQLSEKTARDYMNYLRKLSGKTVNYDLYLEICDNKWKVKLIRIYLDYLYKVGRISWEEKERLKSIFKVKNSSNSGEDDEYEIDEHELIDRMLMMHDESLYRLILELLLYSGARLSEIVKMLREWDEKKLECFNDFCRYRLKWFRGRKRCDYIYFPKQLLDRILRFAHRVGRYDNLRKNIYDYYHIKEKDFRKLHYRVCLDTGIEEAVCDFYQSRISELSIGRKYYDALRSRADKKYPLLIKAIGKLIDRIKEEMSIGVPVENEEIIEIRIGDEVIYPQEPEETLNDTAYEEEKTVYEYRMEF